MNDRLDYRELLKNWMQYYSIPAEISKKMFASIWARVQDAKRRTDEIGERTDGTYLERADRKSKKP